MYGAARVILPGGTGIYPGGVEGDPLSLSRIKRRSGGRAAETRIVREETRITNVNWSNEFNVCRTIMPGCTRYCVSLCYISTLVTP